MNLTFYRPSDAKTVSAFESPVFLHVLVRCGRDLAHWDWLFETCFFRYVSVRYGRLKDIDRTAFVTRQGLFRFTVMPFRLCNAPATFERLMELVLKHLNWKVYLIYLDDIVVYGAGFYSTLDHLKMVWR